jgi:hypothetical protein
MFPVGSVLAAVTLATCRQHDTSTSSLASADATRLEIVPAQASVDARLPFTATVTGREAFVCAYTQDERRWEGPCRRFTVVNSRSGTLVVTVRWNDRHPLALSLRSGEGVPNGIRCCSSPEIIELPVIAGSTIDIQITLLEPWGSDERQTFQVSAALKP